MITSSNLSCGLGGSGLSAGGAGMGVVMVCVAKGGSFPAYSLLIRLNYRPLQVLCQDTRCSGRFDCGLQVIEGEQASGGAFGIFPSVKPWTISDEPW